MVKPKLDLEGKIKRNDKSSKELKKLFNQYNKYCNDKNTPDDIRKMARNKYYAKISAHCRLVNDLKKYQQSSKGQIEMNLMMEKKKRSSVSNTLSSISTVKRKRSHVINYNDDNING